MIQKTIALLAGALALSLPGVGLAAASDYSYAGADYVFYGREDVGSNENYDGWGLNGALSLVGNVYAKVDYSYLNADDNLPDPELFSAGLGYYIPIGTEDNPTDLYATVSYERFRDKSNNDINADGIGVNVGARWQAFANTEINPYVGYVDYGEIDNTNADFHGFRFGVKGLYNITTSLALSAGYRYIKLDVGGFGSDFELQNELRVGVRYYLEKNDSPF